MLHQAALLPGQRPCRCHEPMAQLLSDIQRRKMMTAHYGLGYKSCPLSGCHAPDLANDCGAGILEEIWGHQEGKVATIIVYDGQPPISAVDLEDILDDLRKARAVITSILMAKLACMKTFPWSISILAHSDEDGVAKPGAARLRDEFRRDPRQDVHHPLTWALFRPGSFFSNGLDKFIEGAGRADLPYPVQVLIAVYKFPPCAETCIERKHWEVSDELKKATHVGPVRISLSNRMPMLETWLATGKCTVDDLLAMFQKARSL